MLLFINEIQVIYYCNIFFKKLIKYTLDKILCINKFNFWFKLK